MERNGAKKGKASRFTGVFRAGSKWKAQLQHKNRSIYLGCYATEEEAAAVYQAEKSRIMTEVEGSAPAAVVAASITHPQASLSFRMSMSSPFRHVSVQPFSSVGDTTASSQTVEDNNAVVAAATAVQDAGVENRILLCVEVGRVAELAEKIRLGERLAATPAYQSSN